MMTMDEQYLQFMINNSEGLTDIELNGLQQRLDAYKQFDIDKKDMQQEALITAAADGEVLASLTLQSTEGMKMLWQDLARDGIGAVSQGIADSLFSQESLSKSLEATLKGVGRTFIQTLIEIGIQKTVLAGIDILLGKKVMAAKQIEMAGIAASSAPAAVGVTLATGGVSAGTSMIALAAATAAGMALMAGLSGKFHAGGLVPNLPGGEGTFLLKSGEYVSSPNETKMFQNYVQSSSKDRNTPANKNIMINLNASSVDAEGMTKMLTEYQEQIYEMVAFDTEEEQSRYSR